MNNIFPLSLLPFFAAYPADLRTPEVVNTSGGGEGAKDEGQMWETVVPGPGEGRRTQIRVDRGDFFTFLNEETVL